jgi:hypothetical protein
MNEDVQIIRDLVADHDPATGLIAAEAHSDADGRATLARILATAAARSARAARRDAILPIAVCAAIAATLVLLVSRMADVGVPALAATPAPLAYHLPARAAPSGRKVLLRLATVAARLPTPSAPGGPYAYVRTAGWYLDTQVSGERSTSKVLASMTETWTNTSGSSRWITRRVPGNGSHVTVSALGPVTGRDTASHGSTPIRLSNDPSVIAHQLDIGHPRRIGPVERFVSLTDLALLQPIASQAQSAILRVLARSPGLIDSGEVTDRAGRRGVAVSLDSAYSGLPTRYTLIFDPHTGALLGEEETLLGNPGQLNVPPRAVIAYTAYLISDYVASPTARP